MISDSDRAGLTFHFVYDDAGRCVESWGDYRGRKDPSLSEAVPRTLHDGVTPAKGIHHCRFEYHGDGSSDVIDSLRVRRFFGNAFGLLDKMVSGAGVTTATYREDGHVVSITDPMGGTTRYERDDLGRATRIVDPLGGALEITRDERGEVVGIVDASGASRTITRDERGNVRTVRDATNAVTSYRVDARGLATEIVTPRGDKVTCAYDEHGNRTEIVVPGGAAWRYRFDFLGRRVEETAPTGARTGYSFSDRGDLLAVHDPAGGTTRLSWDAERHITSLVSQTGHTTRFAWGGYHRLCERTDAAGHTARMRYDLEGRMIEVHNERGEVHHLDYDPAGLLVAERTFDGRSPRFKYDLAGRLAGIVPAPGETITLTRDLAGRLVARELPDGSIEKFDYDPCGRLIRVEGDGVETVIERDAEGRVVAELQTLRGATVEVRSTFDGEGRRTGRRTSLGHVEEIVRDGLGDRRRTVLDGDHAIVHERDPVGRETARVLAGGARIESLHDAMGRLTRRRIVAPVAHTPGMGEPAWIGERGVVSDVAYGYDADSHIVERLEGGRAGTSYAYDPLGQLLAMAPLPFGGTRGPTGGAHAIPEAAFRYDAAGNLHEEGSSARPRVYGPGNRLERRGDRRYEWNDQAQLTATRAPRPADSGGAEDACRYEYTGSGLLSRVHTPGGDVVEMTYDAFARRLEKRVVRRGAVVRSTRFVWDREQIVHEITQEAAEAGDPVIEERTYVFQDASFEPIAHRVRRGEGDPGRWVHYDNDVSGAPERLLDDKGTVVGRLRHTPWADTMVEGEAWSRTPLRYQGQYEDAETGLRYNRFRYYDPSAGRFTTADPLGLRAGLNAFTYAPNPLEWVDPFGLARFPDSLNGRRTPNQQGVIDIAQAEERRAVNEANASGGTCTPMATQDANALIQLANETGVPVRAKTNDITGAHGFGPVNPTPHIHVNGVHVVVPPGFTPPPGSTVITDSGPTTF
jgi:RHS repeat-associated protein